MSCNVLSTDWQAVAIPVMYLPVAPNNRLVNLEELYLSHNAIEKIEGGCNGFDIRMTLVVGGGWWVVQWLRHPDSLLSPPPPVADPHGHGAARCVGEWLGERVGGWVHMLWVGGEVKWGGG